MENVNIEAERAGYQARARIVSVEARTIRVPLDRHTAFSTRLVAARDYTVVRVRTADDHYGIGFCYGGNRAGMLVTFAVRELFAALLLGRSALDVEGSWCAMYDESLLQGRAGSVMRALSIIDIALWDRNARATGLPFAAPIAPRCRPTRAAATTSKARRLSISARRWPLTSRWGFAP
jgi:L-alanine-DL-glutamate epimerase-like enolase superfamily enzyme